VRAAAGEGERHYRRRSGHGAGQARGVRSEARRVLRGGKLIRRGRMGAPSWRCSETGAHQTDRLALLRIENRRLLIRRLDSRLPGAGRGCLRHSAMRRKGCLRDAHRRGRYLPAIG